MIIELPKPKGRAKLEALESGPHFLEWWGNGTDALIAGLGGIMFYKVRPNAGNGKCLGAYILQSFLTGALKTPRVFNALDAAQEHAEADFAAWLVRVQLRPSP